MLVDKCDLLTVRPIPTSVSQPLAELPQSQSFIEATECRKPRCLINDQCMARYLHHAAQQLRIEVLISDNEQSVIQASSIMVYPRPREHLSYMNGQRNDAGDVLSYLGILQKSSIYNILSTPCHKNAS